MQLGWQPSGLAAEDEHDAVRSCEWRVPEQSRRLRREEVRVAQTRQLLFEHTPIGPHTQIDVFPVVESRAFHLAFVEREAEWLDEVQGGAGSEARSARVPGVPVNLWMHENDVCCWTRHMSALDRRGKLRLFEELGVVHPVNCGVTTTIRCGLELLNETRKTWRQDDEIPGINRRVGMRYARRYEY